MPKPPKHRLSSVPTREDWESVGRAFRSILGSPPQWVPPILAPHEVSRARYFEFSFPRVPGSRMWHPGMQSKVKS